MCRALGIPARLASGLRPGLALMDFHAVVEVWRHERWGRARRDAFGAPAVAGADRDRTAMRPTTAFAATISGDVEMVSTEVFAVFGEDLPADDHVSTVALG